jgi:hypothetical protein
MVVCKFAVADGVINVCAMATLKVKCNGLDIDNDMDNCPF